MPTLDSPIANTDPQPHVAIALPEDSLTGSRFRLWIAYGIVRRFRFRFTTDAVHRAMAAEFGEICRRTVYRDLLFFAAMGLIERQGFGNQGYQWRVVSNADASVSASA